MKRFNHLLLTTIVSAGLTNAYAAPDNYGLSTTVVTTSLVEKIDKNLGQIEVTLDTQCQDSAEAAEQAILEIKNSIEAEANEKISELKHPDLKLKEESDNLTKSNNNKYRLDYSDNESTVKAYIDNCTYEATSLENLDYEEMDLLSKAQYYSASMRLTYVAKSELSKLITLKEHLSTITIKLTEATKNQKDAIKTYVYNPIFDIDGETKQALKEKLTANLDLDSQDNQYTVDQAFFEDITGQGFAEKYVEEFGYKNQQGLLTYFNFNPTLSENENIQLSKVFNFVVDYLPSNLIGSSEENVSLVKQKEFIIKTEADVKLSDVESFIADVNVVTQCQTSVEEVNKVFKSSLNSATEAIKAELDKVDSQGVNEIRLNTAPTPWEDYADTEIGREFIEDKVLKGYLKDGRAFYDKVIRIVPNKWLDNCNKDKTTQENRKKYWSASQSFRVLTTDLNTYKVIKKMAEEISEAGNKSNASSFGNRHSPIVRSENFLLLKNDVWRKVVDAELYEKALYKLTEPDGELDKHLSSDYVQAQSAYYSLGSLNIAQERSAQKSRSQATPQSGLDDSNVAYQDENINIDNTQLDPHTEYGSKKWIVNWKPHVDLVKLIDMRREKGLK